MRISLAILTAILFVLIGCSNTDNDTKEGWENLSGYDFPVYAGHFADYVQTDSYGNVLGNIDYGSNDDDKDWEWFEYSSKNSVTNNLITGISFPETNNLSHNNNIKSFDAHGFIYPGVSETIIPDSVYLNVPFVFKTPALDVCPTTPVIEYQVFPSPPVELSLKDPIYLFSFGVKLFTASQTDHSQLSVTVPAGYWYALAFYNNQWNHAIPSYPAIGPIEISWDDIPFSDTVQVVFSMADPFVPPPFFSFTAMVTNDYHVQLIWITESETNVQGYNLYRSNDVNLSSATVINDSLISSDHPPYQQHTYTFIDDTVELNHTYYYWMEKLSTDSHSSYYGPICVTVDPPPRNFIYPAYPNPFIDNFHLLYSILDSARVNILVINRGYEVVRSYQGNQNGGIHSQSFNMQDLPVGLYRVFYWIEMNNKSYYSYGDVLKQ